MGISVLFLTLIIEMSNVSLFYFFKNVMMWAICDYLYPSFKNTIFYNTFNSSNCNFQHPITIITCQEQPPMSPMSLITVQCYSVSVAIMPDTHLFICLFAHSCVFPITSILFSPSLQIREGQKISASHNTHLA